SSRRIWLERAGIGLTGADVTGGLMTATALMLIVTVAFLLVVKTIGRRVTGVLQALVGIGIVAIVVTHRTATAHQWAAQGVDAGAPQDHVSAWPWVCFVAGALTILSGIGLAVLADRWPSRSARRMGELTGDPRSVWDALDRGEDPTLGDVVEVPAEKAESALPPSHNEASRPGSSESTVDKSVHSDSSGSHNG
ncbi:MAG: Trp biosynthesis-associated membrane protein, partial [Actinomycetota bacterium]